MITTLPGLYLVSVGIVKPVAWLFGWSGSVICSTGMLRFINLLFGIGNVYLLYLLFCRMHHKKVKMHFTSSSVTPIHSNTISTSTF